jgi:ribosomal protein L16 Arg81 hydroxylase
MDMLKWLIDPIGADKFYDEYFERQPLLIERDDVNYYDKVLSVPEIEGLFEIARNLSNFDVSLSNADRELKPSDYSSTYRSNNVLIKTGIDSNAARQLFNDESSFVLISNVASALPKVRDILEKLTRELDCTCYADLFLTPPRVSKGFGIHYDLHDVYVLQLYGAKRWDIYESEVHLPHVPTFYNGFNRNIKSHNLIKEANLTQGNLLYLPRGYVHNVTTTDHLSMHLTIGTTNRMWSDVIEEFVLDVAGRREFMRSSITPGPKNNSQFKKQLKEIRNTLDSELQIENLDMFDARAQCRTRTAKTTTLASVIANIYSKSRKEKLASTL